MRFDERAGERKCYRLELKRVQDNGTFEGYASLFGREDMGRDVVMRGAFADSLAKRGAGGIRMLFQHDPAQVIGVWDEIREDGRGLYVRGRLMLDVAKAREVLALMREGALDGLSIGFQTVKARRDRRSGVRRLLKIDLWEISVVTFPMLPDARVRALKTGRTGQGADRRPFVTKVPRERELERWLVRDAGLTRSEARALLRTGFKGLAARRDAAGARYGDGRLAERINRLARLMRDGQRQQHEGRDDYHE